DYVHQSPQVSSGKLYSHKSERWEHLHFFDWPSTPIHLVCCRRHNIEHIHSWRYAFTKATNHFSAAFILTRPPPTNRGISLTEHRRLHVSTTRTRLMARLGLGHHGAADVGMAST
ncbi:unnamed protein product, partial [Ectocarpus sp. 4 AP-2014]